MGHTGKMCGREHVRFGGHGSEDDVGLGQFGVHPFETAGPEFRAFSRFAHEVLSPGQ